MWEIVYSNYLREKGIKSMGSNYGYNATILNIEEYIDHSESIDLLDFIDFSIFIIIKYTIPANTKNMIKKPKV